MDNIQVYKLSGIPNLKKKSKHKSKHILQVENNQTTVLKNETAQKILSQKYSFLKIRTNILHK